MKFVRSLAVPLAILLILVLISACLILLSIGGQWVWEQMVGQLGLPLSVVLGLFVMGSVMWCLAMWLGRRLSEDVSIR